MNPKMMQELSTISQQHVDNLLGNVFAELDKLKQKIQNKDKARPDTDLLIKNKAPFVYFEFLAIACFRLRGKWKRAGDGQRMLEQRRSEWNVVICAALAHARQDIAVLEKGTEEYAAQVDRTLALLDLLTMTFRPLNGPNSGWIAITAAGIGSGQQ